jgi:poly-beta-1,6-N-acetyl-D-glucosamine biosynthesis protein PgaD
MPPGKAPIGESSSIRELLARRWSQRRPVPTGLLSVFTLLFWAVWVYLVLPLATAVMWVLGVRLFGERMEADGYEGLRHSLISYSGVLLVLVGLLAVWIAWNVFRYGGSSDRRTVKRAEVTDPEVWEAFRLDDSLLEPLRQARMVRIDVNAAGCVVVLATHQARVVSPLPERPVGELAGV